MDYALDINGRSSSITRDYLVKHERPDWNEFENGLRRSGKGGGA